MVQKSFFYWSKWKDHGGLMSNRGARKVL